MKTWSVIFLITLSTASFATNQRQETDKENMPSIDAQFFVAAMIKYGDVIQPKSLWDVGCGTAYLCIAAAHRWLTLNRVELLDIDPLAVAAAKLNLDSDPVTHEVKHTVHAIDFKHYNGQG